MKQLLYNDNIKDTDFERRAVLCLNEYLLGMQAGDVGGKLI